MACTTKHTEYQPTNEEWRCPNCGKGVEAFWIEHNANEEGNCELLHDDDEIVCFSCSYATDGKEFAASVGKENAMVPCPCCEGTGLVREDRRIDIISTVGLTL